MRPLSTADLRTIAAYLLGTRARLRTSLSELGFDPDKYPRIRAWLRKIHFVRNKKTHLWSYDYE